MFIIISKKKHNFIIPIISQVFKHPPRSLNNHEPSRISPGAIQLCGRQENVDGVKASTVESIFPDDFHHWKNRCCSCGCFKGPVLLEKGYFRFTSGHEMKKFVSQKISQLFSFAEVKRMQKWNFHRKKNTMTELSQWSKIETSGGISEFYQFPVWQAAHLHTLLLLT